MKINRSTHFMILVLFAIAFVVIYLYYTIKDVKKIHAEIARLSNDVLQLTQSITNITNTLINQAAPLASSAAVCMAPFAQTSSTQGINKVQVTIPVGTVDEAETGSVSGDSVATAEMHKIIESIDEVEDTHETQEAEQVDVQTAPQSVMSTNTQSPLDVKQLKSLPYDALKKYCKDNGLDSKGTKDALVARIVATQQTVA